MAYKSMFTGREIDKILKKVQSGEVGGGEGVGITITRVQESDIDGGTNVISFSDGTDVNIKNGKTGGKGDPGAPGGAGIGIANVAQTVKSEADGGTNVVTITLTDGTKHTFEVKNGNKGRMLEVIDIDESLADDEHNRVLFSDGSVLKVKNGRTGSPGKDGESITITNKYESNVNGGNNYVTFSDGTVLRIKNGDMGLVERPDWGENDPNAETYIRNRTHWIEQALEVIVADSGLGGNEIYEGFNDGFENPLVLKVVAGEKYAINTDTSVYHYCTAYDYTDSNGDAFIALGDSRLDEVGGTASEAHPEDVPVFIKYNVIEGTTSSGGVSYRHKFRFLYSEPNANNAKLSALGSDVVYRPLDERFIPDSIARKKDIEFVGGGGIIVTNVSESTEDGGANVVTFSDGTTITIKNGSRGSTGERGLQGVQGDKGADGLSATHAWNGTTLSITSASGTSSADLKGEKGDKGDKGDQGAQGVQGEKGDKGDKGADGTVAFNDLTDEQKATLVGVYVGEDAPPDTAQVWVKQGGVPSSTEAWTFTLEDGTTVTKSVVVV